MRGTDYEFVAADSAATLSYLISRYEDITGRDLQPADPDRLFLSWVADVFVAERVKLNYAGNQNIPSRATGENLDALGEWIFGVTRNPAQPAKCTVRFTISAAQSSAQIIPAGTRVSTSSQSLTWETTADAVIPIGDTYVDVMVQCMTAGLIGNGYVPGQITTLIDVDNIRYFSSCTNTTESDGGSDEESDDDYYSRMRLALDSYSTAGSAGSYIYWAKSVSGEIADVKAIRPRTLRTVTIPELDTGSGSIYVLGGDSLDTASLKVYPHGSSTAAELTTDYTIDYTDGLLTITPVASGAIDGESSIDIEIGAQMGGHVVIYALMDDGTPAGSTIKSAIEAACNADDVRPLTDDVSVDDPEAVNYSVNLTYYMPLDSTIPAADMQAAVEAAVAEYVRWQSARLGRDVNPAKLWQLLMSTGIKRATITYPEFTELSSGADGSAPQLATLSGTPVITNGGYEDE